MARLYRVVAAPQTLRGAQRARRDRKAKQVAKNCGRSVQVCDSRPSGETHMATITATEQNFESLIEKGDIVIFDFWAEWCGPCKSFGPIFEAASNVHADVTFAKVDTEAQPGLAQAFGVRAIPMIAVFRQQVLLYAEAGALPGAALEELITQARALDMAKVKEEIAAEEAKKKAAAGG
jgi:thioredoxin 1